MAMDKKDNVEKARIHWTLALIPLAVLVALQVLVIREFGSDALDGASQTALLVAAAVAVAMVVHELPVTSDTSALMRQATKRNTDGETTCMP